MVLANRRSWLARPAGQSGLSRLSRLFGLPGAVGGSGLSRLSGLSRQSRPSGPHDSPGSPYCLVTHSPAFPPARRRVMPIGVPDPDWRILRRWKGSHRNEFRRFADLHE